MWVRREVRCSGRGSPFPSCSSALHGGLTQLKGEYRSSTSKIKNMAHQEEVNHELCVLIRDYKLNLFSLCVVL